MAESWRLDEIAVHTGRLRAVPSQGSVTATSADAPREFALRAGAREAPARQPPINDGARASAAGRLNAGVLKGSGLSPPKHAPFEHAPRRQTIVHVDVAKASSRLHDPASLESRHRQERERADAPSISSGEDEPAAAGAHARRAFSAHNGGPSHFVSRAVNFRAVTPSLSSHQRLSSLEDTLAQGTTALWTTGPAGYVRGSAAEASAGQAGRSSTGEDDELDDGRWPLPSRQPVGASFNGLPRTAHAGAGYAFTTGMIARRPATARFSSFEAGVGGGAEDMSATRALGWVSDLPGGEAAALQRLSAAAAATPQLFDIPPAAPLLRSKADAETFLSRASRTAINPRTRASALDASLGKLVAANSAAAARLMGHGLPGSAAGVEGTQAAILAASVRLPADAGAAAAAFESSQLLQQQLQRNASVSAGSDGGAEAGAGAGAVAGGSSQSTSDLDQTFVHPQRQQDGDQWQQQYGSSGHGRSVGGGFRASLNGLAGPNSGTNDVPRRTTAHMGGESWTSRESYTLVALPRSEEMLRQGAMQARFTTRLQSHHEMDLTHGFVDKGIWRTMNLMGNSRSPGRRPLPPAPLPESSSALAATAAAFPPQATHSVDDRAYGYGAAASAGVLLDGEQTPLGVLMKERAQQLPLAAETLQPRQVDALRRGASKQEGRVRQHPDSLALDDFDAAHRVGDPRNWPEKILRAKILGSGVADRVGFLTPESLSRATKVQLLAALDRVPAARRMLSLLGDGALSPRSRHDGDRDAAPSSLSELSSMSFSGAIGVNTNVMLGRSNAIEMTLR